MYYDFKHKIGDIIDYNGRGESEQVKVWGHYIQLNEEDMEVPYYRFGPLNGPYENENFFYVDAAAMDNTSKGDNDPPPGCPPPLKPPC